MDFGFSEEQEALRELARKILGDHTAHDRLKEIEKGPDWFDHALWMELAKANLLGVALPATVGGSGLGFLVDGPDAARANESATHIDFMIGSPELEVTGVTGDGERVPILRDGDWQL